MIDASSKIAFPDIFCVSETTKIASETNELATSASSTLRYRSLLYSQATMTKVTNPAHQPTATRA